MGHCRFCGHGAGWFRSSHRQCAATYRQGLAQLVDLVAAASGRPDFTQRRMLSILDALVQQCYVPAEYQPAVLAAGWHLSDMNRMVDDVLTRSETVRLREFRDGHHPASETPDDRGASILAAAACAALATRQRSQRMERVSNLLQRSGLSHEEGRELLLQAWETAVARQLDDGELDHNGMLRQLVQGAAIAESAAGLVPQRMNFPQGAPAAALLRRSEQLVWLFDDVECCLGQLPPEPSPTITGVAAPGRDLPYCRPQSFVDRQAPDQGWESVARSQLAVASQHLHFRGPGLSIRLAYGSVMHWEPYHDGIGAVPRAQPNQLVVFRNGDGWFIYNLTRNLAAAANRSTRVLFGMDDHVERLAALPGEQDLQYPLQARYIPDEVEALSRQPVAAAEPETADSETASLDVGDGRVVIYAGAVHLHLHLHITIAAAPNGGGNDGDGLPTVQDR